MPNPPTGHLVTSVPLLCKHEKSRRSGTNDGAKAATGWAAGVLAGVRLSESFWDQIKPGTPKGASGSQIGYLT